MSVRKIYTSVYHADGKNYEVFVGDYTCNKFGLAEFLAMHHSKLPLKGCKTAIDVGGGVGVIALFLADFYGIHVTSVDINPLAHFCCIENIKKYRVEDRITALNFNFSMYPLFALKDKYDLIIANPPIGNFFLYDDKFRNIHVSGIQHMVDDKLFSFITNAWCDETGSDLVDYVFRFASEHLKENGYIILICCDLEVDSDLYVTKKCLNFNYHKAKVIDGYILPQSIGVDNFMKYDIKSHIFLIEKGVKN